MSPEVKPAPQLAVSILVTEQMKQWHTVSALSSVCGANTTLHDITEHSTSCVPSIKIKLLQNNKH